MRIADHAVVLQGSQVLQQPSNTVHQQQVQAPMLSRAAAAVEAQRQANQVNESNKTENRGVRGYPERSENEPERPEPKPKKSAPASGNDESERTPSQPGNGGLFDIVA